VKPTQKFEAITPRLPVSNVEKAPELLRRPAWIFIRVKVG
jgi:hypothetical protein